MKIMVVTATAFEGGWKKYFNSNVLHCAAGVDHYLNKPNIGVVAAYQDLYLLHQPKSDVIVYLHDDLEIHEESWLPRVEEQFAHDEVAVVGFGGAAGLGHTDIYKIPYRIDQLAREGYRSNQRDWGVHGSRLYGSEQVAVIDGFALAIRTSFLKEAGGWPVDHLSFHCYDLWACLMAARLGYQVRAVGIDCTHHGGGTSTKAEYVEWLKDKGRTPEQDHAEPHVWIYDEFRDVLPLRLPIELMLS